LNKKLQCILFAKCICNEIWKSYVFVPHMCICTQSWLIPWCRNQSTCH